MSSDKYVKGQNPGEDQFSKAGTGNASNPPVENTNLETNKNQLLNEKAETYLREAGNIEDMPDEKDWDDANDVINKNKDNN